jgi:hypothetical protein
MWGSNQMSLSVQMEPSGYEAEAEPFGKNLGLEPSESLRAGTIRSWVWGGGTPSNMGSSVQISQH